MNQKTRDDGTLMRDTTGAAAGGGEATTRARSRRCASAPAGTRARTGHRSSTCSPSGSAPRVGPTASNRTCVEIKFLRRVRGHRVIDATPARWRGDASSSPLDRARMAASSPGNDLVKNCRVHATHWLISAQVDAVQRFGQTLVALEVEPRAWSWSARVSQMSFRQNLS